ncbi:hypothetical protein BD324DRAFT_649949 [Kockovaella imperatae]|uniref:Uncharacterized protein n=1 Tax=Kockovaella imperatae TaxID=4999 RepID=A0A1Y1UKK8_9TREE|nr:hypothetical protein BD324DRAFT_649949 [Kockovaella imperatae]ORX38591.1 hypothetical protein BD324DRAFT_649949 [Kockovaella imperatae]
MPPGSTGLRSALLLRRAAISATQLDFLIPWAANARPRFESYSTGAGDSLKECQEPVAGPSNDRAALNHEAAETEPKGASADSSRSVETQPLDIPDGTASEESPRSRGRRRIRLSEEVASLSTSLQVLLEPWDINPQMLPGIRLPLPTSTPPTPVSPESSVEPIPVSRIQPRRPWADIIAESLEEARRFREAQALRDLSTRSLERYKSHASGPPYYTVEEMDRLQRQDEQADSIQNLHPERTVPLTQANAARSFVKHHLLRTSPPPPSTLLDHLRVRRELFTAQNAKILLRYAARVNDHKTYSEVRRALLVLQQAGHRRRWPRLATSHRLGGSRRSYIMRKIIRLLTRGARGDGAAVSEIDHADVDKAVEKIDAELSKTEGDPDGIDYPQRRVSKYWYFCPHPWAESSIPVVDTPIARPDVLEILGTLHYRLLTGDVVRPTPAPTFSGPIGKDLIRSTRKGHRNETSSVATSSENADFKTSPPSILHYADIWFSQPDYDSPFLKSVQRVVDACAAAGKQQQGTRQYLLMVLHLYIIYANRVDAWRQPHDIPPGCSTILYDKLSRRYPEVLALEEYSRLYGRFKPSRQTLHLLLLRVLFGGPILRFPLNPADIPPLNKRMTSADPPIELPYRVPDRPDPTDAPRLIADARTILKVFESRWRIWAGPETINRMTSYALQVNDEQFAKECWDDWWHEMSRVTARESRWEGDHPRWDHRSKHSNSWKRMCHALEKRGWIQALRSKKIDFKDPSIGLDLELHDEDVFPEFGARLDDTPSISSRPPQIHPDIHRGEDVDGTVWIGFADCKPRYRWTGTQTGAHDVAAQEMSGMSPDNSNVVDLEQAPLYIDPNTELSALVVQ